MTRREEREREGAVEERKGRMLLNECGGRRAETEKVEEEEEGRRRGKRRRRNKSRNRSRRWKKSTGRKRT